MRKYSYGRQILSLLTIAIMLLGSFAPVALAGGSQGGESKYGHNVLTIDLSSWDVTVEKGKSTTINVSLSPATEDQLPTCGMDVCPLTCGDGCIDANGWCTCAGSDYTPQAAKISSVTSGNSAVAVASQAGSQITIVGNEVGNTNVTVVASLRMHSNATAQIAVTVTDSGSGEPANNTPPTVENYNVDVAYNTAASGKVTGLDQDGDSLSYSKGSAPSHGTVSINASGNWTYTPSPGYSGSDSFTVIVSDGKGGTATSTVSITVGAKTGNTPPTVGTYTMTTNYNTPISGNTGGTDADGDPLTYSKGSDPAHGTVTVNSNGSWTYTPANGYSGSDSFTVMVSDGQGGTATAVFNLTIKPAGGSGGGTPTAPVNNSPTVDNYTASTSLNTAVGGTVSGKDGDGDALTYSKGSDPVHGTVIVNSDGSWTYTPTAGYSGDDSFTVTVSDDKGGKAVSTVSVSISGKPNTPPSVGNYTVSTAYGTTASGKVVATDGDGDTLMYSKGSDPAYGTVAVNSDGSWTYTPAYGYSGSDSFGVAVSDGKGGINVSTVTVTVAPHFPDPSTVQPGGDNSAYNQSMLDILNSAQADQKAKAQFPAGSSSVDSGATAPTILTAQDGVRVTVPAGALGNFGGSVQFSAGLGSITTAPVNSSTVVLNPLKYQRQFGVTGQSENQTQFQAPVVVSFPITQGDLPGGVNTPQLAIYWWNAEKGTWTKMGGTFNASTGLLSVSTYHFSTYAVMADTSSVPERLAGTERYDTANAVAEQGWKDGADNIVMVNAYAYSDALAATPLAYKLNAPILLTDAKGLSASTAAELKALNPKHITLIGGTAVISQAIEDQLKSSYGAANVTRYGGYDLYDTAALIAQALGSTGKAVIVNGEPGHYTDALSISSYAAYYGIPILFTQTAQLPAATANALKTLRVGETIVVGGTVVVPERIVTQLSGVSRYAGIDSYQTATAVATGLNMNLSRVYVATGLNFADALVAGNLAAHTLSPILLVDKGIPTSTQSFLTANKGAITGLTAVGGNAVITPDQYSRLQGYLK